MAVETPSRKGLQLAKWSNMVSALLADEPELLEGLPDEFQLVTLPQQEPELWPYALGLVEPRGTIPVVYALIEVGRVVFLLPHGPQGALGEVNAERYISLLCREPFDYTVWQRQLLAEKSLEALSAAASAARANAQKTGAPKT